MSDLQSLLDRDDVLSRTETREFDEETFEALRARYKTIDGVVQIGVINDENEVLLLGDEGTEWTLPGGDVETDEDWTAAARRAIKELTDATIEVEHPKLIEQTIFTSQNGSGDEFAASVVHFSASPAESESEFINNPSVADDLDHKYIEDKDAIDFEWFDSIPDDADPNHEDHIRLFVE